MHLVSRTVWSLVGWMACLAAVVNAAGVLEIDVVFPRNNGTYAPSKFFPIVFALQNGNLAKHLAPAIYSFIRNGSNLESTFGQSSRDLTYANYSSEPYFVWNLEDIDAEGRYQLLATAAWQSCNVSGDQVSIGGGDINFGVTFIIKKGGQEVDLRAAPAGLVAATADDKTCSAKHGVALNVTGQTYEVPASLDSRKLSGTCGVLASSSPTPTANPCRVKIDTAVAASMSAFLHASMCKGINPPADCPKENAVQQLAVAGVTSFAGVFGALGFLLASL